MLKGRKLLERGDYAEAVDQFKTATVLLPTKMHRHGIIWASLINMRGKQSMPSQRINAHSRWIVTWSEGALQSGFALAGTGQAG